MGRLTRAVNDTIDVCALPILGGVAGYAASFGADRLMRWVRPDDTYEPEIVGWSDP